MLALEPEVTDPDQALRRAAGRRRAGRRDTAGCGCRTGRLTALVSDRPEECGAVADRLGRYADGEVRWGDVPLPACPATSYAAASWSSDAGSTLFSGVAARRRRHPRHGGDRGCAARAARPPPPRTCSRRSRRPGHAGRRARPVVLRRPAPAAGARPGARRRPRGAVLVEPTSAVDAHTEARIADRLHEQRAGRTTVVTTTSPLLLDRVDQVAFLRGRRGGRRRHAPRPAARGARTTAPCVTREGGGDPMSDPPAGRRPAPRSAATRLRLRPAAPAAICGARWPCTGSRRSPRWPRRGCSATSSRRSQSGTTLATSTHDRRCAGRVPGAADRADPVRAATSRSCSASRCSPSCARTSSRTRWRCRSASSSRPAAATCSPARRATSSSSAGRCAGRCPSG